MDERFIDEWRDIEGFPEWLVSSQGNVLSNWTHRIASLRTNQQNLVMVNLYQDKKIHTRLVSLLVAKAFLDPPKNSSYNSIIYLNGDKTDCRAINLMWRPRWYALRYHQMFEDLPKRISVYVPAIDRTFFSLREFCTTYGLIERNTYIDILNCQPCFHYGWIVERYEE